MKKIVLLLVITTLFSCRGTLNLTDFNYLGQTNYDNIYVVDTIKIPNPILIYFGGGSMFVTSKDIFLQQKEINKSFFVRPDVFLFHFSISRDYPSSVLKTYPIHNSKNIEMGDVTKINKYETREFKCDSIQFILGLINVNYYNVKFNNLDNYFYINQKNQKINFFKIVYPLCL